VADELISKGERDALLDAVRQGRIFTREGARRRQEPKVHEYDFRRPHRLSVENMRLFQRIHSRAAENMGALFTRLLGHKVTVTAASLEEMPYRLFTDDVPKLCYGIVVGLNPVKEHGLVLLQVPMCMQLVDQLLGGPGDVIEATRPLTTIDQAVVESGVTMILRALQESWGEFLDIEYTVHERRNEVRMLQLLPFAETVLVVRFELKGGLGDAEIRVCLPIRSMKEAMDKRTHSDPGALRNGKAEQHRAHLAENLKDADLAVGAVLGSADVSISDMLALREGQVLRLDQRTAQPLDVTVNGKLLFLAKAGLHGRSKAVQIIRRTGVQDTRDDT